MRRGAIEERGRKGLHELIPDTGGLAVCLVLALPA